MTMSDLQQYPWNHNLIKNVEDIVVFLTGKVFISVSFFIASYMQEIRHLSKEPGNEIEQFKETKQ